MKHSSSLADDPENLRNLHGLCKERLKELGINVSIKSQKAKSKHHFPTTPGKKLGTPAKASSVFGRPLRDLAPSSIILDSEDVRVPHFLVAILNYLRENIETDGLFRKAGSAGRQRTLRIDIEEAETFFIQESDKDCISPLDVGSLLKQWLRELPEPLIPTRFHDTFLKCCKLTGEAKTGAVLTACLLLPPLHAAALSSLMRFLSEVSNASESNKMDARSLAIVFTPSLFPVTENATNIKKVESTNADLANKLDIVETLIKNSKMVCIIDQKMDEALSIVMPSSEDNAELSFDEDFEVYGATAGPSARRRKSNNKNKKRRSGSLSRVITATMKGLHKAIRSTTPAGIRSASSHSNDLNSAAQTPIFQSPRLPVKRKVSVDEPDNLSPNSKHRKAAMESSFTPKVMRARSVSIKNRFKRKKSLDGNKFKEPSLIIHHPFDANALVKTPGLPDKPCISITAATPKTPGLGLPTANQDLSSQDEELAEEDVKNTNQLLPQSANSSFKSSNTSLSSSTSITSTKSFPGRVVKRHNKPRSPSERKIGLVRRRSQEMALKKVLIKDEKNKYVLPAPNIVDDVKLTQLKRGKPNTFRIKPSPMKIENSTPDGRKTTRIKISFREGQLQSPRVHIKNPKEANEEEAAKKNDSKNGSKNDSKSFKVNESLSNLRQDISSMIEQSFGPFQDPDDHEVIINEKSFATENEPDKFTLEELTFPINPNSILTRSMRRQSSAFEIKPAKPWNTNQGPSTNVRRQSSAFELAAIKKELPQQPFHRTTNRASLKNRNSSVKDLVKKLEVVQQPDTNCELDSLSAGFTEMSSVTTGNSKRMSISTSVLPQPFGTRPELMLPSPPKETPRVERGRSRRRTPVIISPTEIEESKDDFPASNDGEWMDASDFFNNKHPNPSRTAQLAFEETPGCKRSSIIAIRTQKKGHVSRNVETFMKPALPPPPISNTPRRGTRPPARTPTSACIPPGPTTATAASGSRRTSARMGIAGKTPTLTGTGSGNGMVTRRQTLTGIRTSVVPASSDKRASMQRNSPIIKAEHTVMYTGNIQEPIYDNVEYIKKPNIISLSNNKKTNEAVKTPTRRTNTPKGRTTSNGCNNKRYKRGNDRRFQTIIGYDGEVRSPLKDKQNTIVKQVATVQRSKSAQNATSNKNNKKVVNNKREDIIIAKENDVNNVHRSISLRSPRPKNLEVPASLRDTIYDVTTPKSEKVKRHLSDRVMTPKGGRQEAIPFIKDVLASNRGRNGGNGNQNNQRMRKSPRAAARF